MLKHLFRVKTKEKIPTPKVEKQSAELLNFSEVIDIVFLVLPYIKFIKRARAEYRSKSEADLFRFMIHTLLDGMDKKDIYKAFSIALRKSEDEIQKMEMKELVLLAPKLIRDNGLLEVYLLMKKLGALDAG